MKPSKKQIDAMFWERVKRARARRLEDKLLSGAELFDEACARMDAGIRAQFPDADEDRVRAIRTERLNRVRRLQDHHVWK